VRSSSDQIPEPPVIGIDPRYNPFDNEDRPGERSGFIDRFERENTSNWQKLYSSMEKSYDSAGNADRIGDSPRRFFQIKNKYIVCPVKSGLMLIDQKRAHERILYERFLEYLTNDKSVSQVDMFPAAMELNPADYFIIKEIEASLLKLGIQIRHDGNNTISIVGRPSESTASDPVEMMEIIIEDYKNTDTDPAKGAKEKISSALAAASAIPYGKSLTHSEMEELFDMLFACAGPNYSPSGKPVISILTTEEIDKRFK
jgi:DNA mismatch repair protein MutL